MVKMTKTSLLVLIFLAQVPFAIGTKPIVIFQKDIDRDVSLRKSYSIKLCIGDLSYAAMAAKIDDSQCRKRSDISYSDCMKIGTKDRDFSQLIINKMFKVKTGDVVYLKNNVKYSFSTGSGGIVKNFTKESNSTFLFHTANYGGVALDSVKKCP